MVHLKTRPLCGWKAVFPLWPHRAVMSGCPEVHLCNTAARWKVKLPEQWVYLWVDCTYELLHALGLRSVAPLVALLTNDGLPLPIGLCDLIGAAHLAEGHAADDEDYDTRSGAVLSRCLVLVPVAVPSTAGAERKTGSPYYSFIARPFPPFRHPSLFYLSLLSQFCEFNVKLLFIQWQWHDGCSLSTF